MSKLSHKNIICFIDVVTKDNVRWNVLPFYENGCLKNYLKNNDGKKDRTMLREQVWKEFLLLCDDNNNWKQAGKKLQSIKLSTAKYDTLIFSCIMSPRLTYLLIKSFIFLTKF